MNKKEFNDIFDKKIFENSKFKFVDKVRLDPYFLLTIFKVSNDKNKIIQTLSTSYEIKFGDAIEEFFYETINNNDNYEMLERNVNFKDAKLSIDLFFKEKNKKKIYLIEIKVRDNHDSTKKKGQIENWEDKIQFALDEYEDYEIFPIMYFLDPGYSKNIKYYTESADKILEDLPELKAYGLWYGSDIFKKIPNFNMEWKQFEDLLLNWKNNVVNDEFWNWDVFPEDTFNSLKSGKVIAITRFFSNKDIGERFFDTLFPTGESLEMLKKYYEEKEGLRFQMASQAIEKAIKRNWE